MKAIVIYYPDRENHDENTIENGVLYTEKDLTVEEIEEDYNIKLVCFIPLEVKGKTYAERKADLQSKAIEWSNNWGLGGDWHFSNIIEIESFFEEQGKKYGLLREFHENAIC